MKNLVEIKDEVAQDYGYENYEDMEQNILFDGNDCEVMPAFDDIAQRYAQSVAEDLRKRIIQEAFDDPYDIRRYANSIRNVEIITP